jgi:hypothetical protein
MRLLVLIFLIGEFDISNCGSGFTIFLPVLLQEQSTVILLLERALISWSLAIDERGGYEDLRGSGRRSVIPYVYERI